MKGLSTDHETARKQVWLREKERVTREQEAMHSPSLDVDSYAYEMADLWLADFDKRFPKDTKSRTVNGMINEFVIEARYYRPR